MGAESLNCSQKAPNARICAICSVITIAAQNTSHIHWSPPECTAKCTTSLQQPAAISQQATRTQMLDLMPPHACSQVHTHRKFQHNMPPQHALHKAAQEAPSHPNRDKLPCLAKKSLSSAFLYQSALRASCSHGCTGTLHRHCADRHRIQIGHRQRYGPPLKKLCLCNIHAATAEWRPMLADRPTQRGLLQDQTTG